MNKVTIKTVQLVNEHKLEYTYVGQGFGNFYFLHGTKNPTIGAYTSNEVKEIFGISIDIIINKLKIN